MIALDVDGVICDWWGGILRTAKVMGLRDELPLHRNWVHEWYGKGTAFNKVWDSVKSNTEWWLGLDPIAGARDAIQFDLECLLTARPCEPAITYSWAASHGFKQKWVRNVAKGRKKVDVMREFGYRVLVDDKPAVLEEVRAAENPLLTCYLMDQPWNRLHDDAGYRIKSLAEVPVRKLGEAPPPIGGTA